MANIKHWELVEEANKFLQENYNAKLEIPIEFNTRIKKCLGRFISKRSIPEKIEMSVNLMQYYPREHIIDVLRHELVHYILLVKGLPNADGHPTFENELRKHGIASTNYYEAFGELHKYECVNCKNTYNRRKKLGSSARCKCSPFPNLQYSGTFIRTYASTQTK